MSASVWKKVSLGQIGSFSNGVNKPKENFGHGTRFVNISDVFLPDLIIRNLDRVEITNIEESYYGLQSDDILFVRSSVKLDGVGYNTIFKGSSEPVVFCGFVIRFRKSLNEVNAPFLNYLLRSDEYRKQIISYSTVSANTNINQVSLKRIEIKYPQEITQQKRISDILSTCDTVIQNTQKTIEKYKAIKQGMMQDLFTRGLTKDGKLRPSFEEAPELYILSELGMIPKEWEVKTIGECADLSSGNTPSRENESNFLGSIRWVTSGELKQKYLQETSEKISTQAIKKHSLKLYESGTVVIAIYGLEAEGTRGSCSILSKSCTISQACLAFSNFKFTNNEYLYYWYLLNGKTVGLKYAQGTKQQNLASETVSNLKIKFPDLTEQIAIANRLSSIDSTIQKEEAILAKYKNIKTGLMARLLTPPEDAQIIDETEE